MNSSYKPFYISTFEQDSGLNQYFESFLIPEKAFQKLEDAMCWRGKIIKRPGNSLLGRLRRKINSVTLTNQANGAVYNVADFFSDAAINLRAPAVGIKETYAEIEPGSVSIIVGAFTFNDWYSDGNLYSAPLPIPGLITGTVNYVTGEINLTFAPPLGIATNVVVTLFYFPTLPVMSLQRREASAINDEQPIAFDTKYAYTISGLKFIELPSTTATTWTGEDWNLFWASNYYIKPAPLGRLYWATNNNIGATPDPIRYYDGATWNTFAPQIDAAANKLQQCRILIGYKNRLIAMNTWEGAALPGTNYPNRARWSANADPTGATAWRQDIVGQGSYITAPTNESIISAAFIKDVLIVKFERSSWKLIYTGNENLPFVFQKVDTDLGSESPFSLVTFDKGVLAVGDKAITVDDSVNVTRIDMTVPDAVFTIQNASSGTERVYGIRDYVGEVVYWTYPDGTTGGPAPTFPNKILVYNYTNDTWCKFNDSYTCYGYFQKLQSKTWADFTDKDNDTWQSLLYSWNSGVEQSLFPDVVAGNQEGFVSILSNARSPNANNERTLTIHAINGTTDPVQLTVPDHNLLTGQFIKIRGIIGTVGVTGLNPNTLNNINYPGTNRIFKIIRVDKDTISLTEFNSITESFDNIDLSAGGIYSGVYWGNGTITVLNNFDIITKQFSPFYEQGSQCRLGYIDFFTNTTVDGQYTSDVYVDSSFNVSITRDTGRSTNGSNVVSTAPENITLMPFQALQDKIWHRQFTQCLAQNFTVELSLSDKQMAKYDIDASSKEFALHAIAFYLSSNARLVQ